MRREPILPKGEGARRPVLEGRQIRPDTMIGGGVFFVGNGAEAEVRCVILPP